MINFFLISSIGFALVHRSLMLFSSEFALSHRTSRFFLLLNLFVFLFAAIYFKSSVTFWYFIGILFITLKFFPYFFRLLLKKRLQSGLIPLLDCMILSVQSGKSFRNSFQEAIDNQTGWFKIQFIEIYNSLYVSKNVIAMKSAVLKDFQLQLLEISQSQSRCLERTKALRRHLKMREDFRRRSGQVTQQIKMQAIIVTALYLMLLSFVILKFGFISNRKVILFSSVVFLTGLILIFFMGRRFKWKV